MKFLTVDARLTCKHMTGVVQLFTGQHLVTIEGSPVLVAHDPQNKPILGCANVGLTIKPCNFTVTVSQGYSTLIFIENQPVCLDNLNGLTDGTPPGIVQYIVRSPGQKLVEEEA